MKNDFLFDCNREYKQREKSNKPNGLWLSVDESWEDWCKDEMPDWVAERHQLNISLDDVFIINSSTIDEFNERFRIDSYYIDWVEVAKEYKGVYMDWFSIGGLYWENHDLYFWTYGWDVDSICLWDLSNVKSVSKITEDGYLIKN